MKLQKTISIFLSFLILVSSCCCYNPASAAGIDQTNLGNNGSKTVVFVPDEKIIIDSESIEDRLGMQIIKFIKSIPIIGGIAQSILPSFVKNRFCFVKPDETSDNILSKELFPDGSPNPKDVVQGKLGLCYFFAVLSTIAEKDPGLIKENLTEDGQGNVIVRFFNPNDGKPFYIKIQKTVPGLPKVLRFVGNDCLWVQMYVKAFVASGFAGGPFDGGGEKSYRSGEGGFMDTVIRMLTGKETENRGALSIWFSNKENLYNEISDTLSNSGYITCHFSSYLNFIKLIFGSYVDEGLVELHAYSVERAYTDEKGQRWVVIRNPWDSFTSTYNKDGKRILNVSDNTNGYSTLKFEDFLSKAGGIEFCKNKKIKNKGLFKRVADSIDVASALIRAAEYKALAMTGVGIYQCCKKPNKKPNNNNTVVLNKVLDSLPPSKLKEWLISKASRESSN